MPERVPGQRERGMGSEGNSFVSKSWNFNKLPEHRQNQINNQVSNNLMGAIAIDIYTL